ncbi:ethylene-responsive transcription factor ERF [Forsythia ovata]|uniref:Ethylene-responsive transcription factor ERF n=1 Tax=Forsythia ovata TaxID=205694 RepID=A0ABD1W4X4_9LAMI
MDKKATASTSSPAVEQTGEAMNEEVKYKGVRKRKWGKYVSEIRLSNSREKIWLGSYDTAEKAARAFDAALFCLRGPQSKFNFPDDPPNIDGGQSLTPTEIQDVAHQYANDRKHDNTPDPGTGNDVDEHIDWPFWEPDDTIYLDAPLSTDPSLDKSGNFTLDNTDQHNLEVSVHSRKRNVYESAQRNVST